MAFKSVKDDLRKRVLPLITFKYNHAYINRPAMRKMTRARVGYSHHPDLRKVYMSFSDDADYTCLNNGCLSIPRDIRKAVFDTRDKAVARKLTIDIIHDTLWSFNY